MKLPFSNHTNHISSAPKPHGATGCCTGHCRHEICPSSHRMCCLNACPTLSRFLRKQITQNIFLQINNITLSKILKEMRHPPITEPGEEGEQCQEYGLWNSPRMRRIHKNLQDKAGYKHILDPLQFISDGFLPIFLYYCHPDPCSILSSFGWEIRKWFHRFWFFFPIW